MIIFCAGCAHKPIPNGPPQQRPTLFLTLDALVRHHSRSNTTCRLENDYPPMLLCAAGFLHAAQQSFFCCNYGIQRFCSGGLDACERRTEINRAWQVKLERGALSSRLAWYSIVLGTPFRHWCQAGFLLQRASSMAAAFQKELQTLAMK